ncbi:MAG: hypothetical protein OXG39_14945 [Chloroflexi bacterium]|nr:hypothetical protein [Chloroflexota bacterium]
MPAPLLGVTSWAGTVDGLALGLAIASGRLFGMAGGRSAARRERIPERGRAG